VPENRCQTVAAVVVTYNRKQSLGECVDALLDQTRPIDALYIIDNCSTDGTCEFLAKKGLIAPPDRQGRDPVETVQRGIYNCAVDVHYVWLPQNTGGAGGMADGLQRADDAGFDWIWLMDDDLLPSPEALAVLVCKKDQLEAAGHEPFILNSLVLSRAHADGDTLAFPLRELSARGFPKMGHFHWRLSEVHALVHDGLYEWICPFNGTFVPRRVVDVVGVPNRELFIHGDEKDFQCRAAKAFRLYTVVDSPVLHPQPKQGQFDWTQYYNIRNMFLVNRHFNLAALRNAKLIVVSLARGARHGRWGMRLVFRAIRDGLAGRLGKRDDLP
jgi:rhamnopyranosyl-N-acetylglucosaminyl-diphospho-decaprenol beta-1,3/1,4-galactofuranosyltransferase